MIWQILFFAFVVGFAAAEVPSYFPICGRRDPNLDECIVKSVSTLRDKLIKGIPELDIPPGDPLRISQMKLTDQPNFKGVATDINLNGLSTYRVNYLHMNMEKQYFNLDLTIDNITISATYEINAKIIVPIVGTGPITLATNDVGAKVKINYKFVERGGKKYAYFSSVTLNLDIKDYDMDFKADNFDETLQDAIKQALGNSHQEILAVTKPNLEKGISEIILDMGNKIFKHFTFDELFPDRE